MVWVGFLTKYLKDPFLSHNIILFAGTLGIGILNYLYYPALGRLMDPADFGDVQAMVSLFLQAMIFLNVLNLVTVNVVTNQEDQATRNNLIFELEKLTLIVGAAVFALVLVLGPELKTFLNLDAFAPLIALGAAFVISIPLTFHMAYLQGKKKFMDYSVGGMAAAGTKLLASVLLVWLGWKAFGAIMGLVIAQIIGLVYTVWRSHHAGFVHSKATLRPGLPNLKLIKPELRYGLMVLIISLIAILQFSIDIIVVKHYFPPVVAGLYAGVATIARIIYFLTSFASSVLLPSVKLANEPKLNSRLLIKSLAILITMGGFTLLLFTALPIFVTKVMVGSKYLEFASLLPKLSLAIFIVSIINLILIYYLALRRYLVAFVALLGGSITYWLLFNYHSTIAAVVNSLLIGSLIFLGLIVAWMGYSQLRPAPETAHG